ncbi:MAG: DUF167 domain-containing protein [Chthoniobacterales bacterium]
MATLRFHTVPNAKQNKGMGEQGGAIQIKLRAPALEGKANAALCSFLTEELKISERSVLLARGQKSREKIIHFEGLSEEEVRSHYSQKLLELDHLAKPDGGVHERSLGVFRRTSPKPESETSAVPSPAVAAPKSRGCPDERWHTLTRGRPIGGKDESEQSGSPQQKERNRHGQVE